MNEDEIPISHQHAHRQTCLVNVLRETKTLSNNSSHFKLLSNKASVWTFLLSVNIYISNVIRMKVITMRLAHLKICNRFSEFETDRVHTRSKALEASGNLKVNSSIDWQYFPWNLSTCDTVIHLNSWLIRFHVTIVICNLFAAVCLSCEDVFCHLIVKNYMITLIN